MLKDKSTNLEQQLCYDVLDNKNLWIRYIKNSYKVYQKQEFLKKKAELEEGKEESISFKYLKSGQAKLTSQVLNKDNKEVPEVQYTLRNMAMPVLSLQAIQNVAKELGKGNTSVPFLIDDSVPPPPIDDGDITWKERQSIELCWLKKSTNGEWMKIEGPNEYYYNIPNKQVSFSVPTGVVF